MGTRLLTLTFKLVELSTTPSLRQMKIILYGKFVFFSLLESCITPWEPIYGVVSMLHKILRLFLG